MTLLTKQQVCDLLGISPSTLDRRVRAGKIKCRRNPGAERFQTAVTFDRAEIEHLIPKRAPALDPAPAPVGVLLAQPAPTVASLPCKIKPDNRTFAEKFLDRDAADSMGNKADGSNAHFQSGAQSLLGPITPDHGPPVDTQSHMNPALLGTNDTLGNPITVPVAAEGFTRGGSPLAHGLSQETYDAMMNDWKRSGGGRSESEQEQQIRRSNQNISRSFPRG